MVALIGAGKWAEKCGSHRDNALVAGSAVMAGEEGQHQHDKGGGGEGDGQQPHPIEYVGHV